MLDWRQLVYESDEQLARRDVAEVELACAAGLPDAEKIDISLCRRKLDKAAELVRRYTALAFDQFFRPDPATYRNSEPFFRMICLITALQRHCGVRYDPSKKDINVPLGLDGAFIHGILQGEGGTCANLPVLYVAVGRRLNYPLRLVQVPRHLFVRWDDPVTGERLNIEGSGEGVESYNDDHYRRWPEPLDAEMEKAFGFLRSLTPRDELASFLAKRAFQWRDKRLYQKTVDAVAWAAELTATRSAMYPHCLVGMIWEWENHLKTLYPPRFPKIEAIMQKNRRRFTLMPWEVERAIRVLERVEACLFNPRHEAEWWKPLRNHQVPLTPVPSSITVTEMFR
jgi:hypothetical protein